MHLDYFEPEEFSLSLSESDSTRKEVETNRVKEEEEGDLVVASASVVVYWRCCCRFLFWGPPLSGCVDCVLFPSVLSRSLSLSLSLSLSV
jgi:hypothetical protein